MPEGVTSRHESYILKKVKGEMSTMLTLVFLNNLKLWQLFED